MLCKKKNNKQTLNNLHFMLNTNKRTLYASIPTQLNLSRGTHSRMLGELPLNSCLLASSKAGMLHWYYPILPLFRFPKWLFHRFHGLLLADELLLLGWQSHQRNSTGSHHHNIQLPKPLCSEKCQRLKCIFYATH